MRRSSSVLVVITLFIPHLFFNLITTHWRAALLPVQLRTAKRGLSGFIFDSRPAYPWRRDAEFELAVGGVGVLSTRAGGGGGWEEEKPETLYTMYEGGTTVAPHCRPPPFQVQEEVSTTLGFWAPSALKNKDIQQNSNVRSTITLHLDIKQVKENAFFINESLTHIYLSGFGSWLQPKRYSATYYFNMCCLDFFFQRIVQHSSGEPKLLLKIDMRLNSLF